MTWRVWKFRAAWGWAGLSVLLAPLSAPARVTRVVVESRAPLAQPASAAYVKLTGRFHGDLDPANPRNAIITDLKLAPRNAAGRVEYSATFTLLMPSDPARLSGVLLYEVPNRGNSPLNARLSNDDLAAGHALLSSGWQGDLTPRPGLETIRVPAARNSGGSSITGPVLARLSNLPAGATTASLATGFAGLTYQRPASLETSRASLTRYSSGEGPPAPVPTAEWAFADCTETPFPGQPDPSKLCLKGGFSSAHLYQLVYTARDPLVLGIGLAATRDIVSFFRYARHDSHRVANPLAGRIRSALGFGTSQAGNFLKTFVHLGFNQDESRRIVWDGINPNIAARLTPLNFRFAIPGGAAGLYEPGSEGVLWWGSYRDDLRQRSRTSLLDRCRSTATCPRVFETFGSAEFWGLRMSPGLTGTRADVDIPLPPEVRRYYFPGVTHGGGRGGFQSAAAPPAARNCLLPDNPNSTAEVMRALRRALIDWVARGVAPPPDAYPRLDRGELVRPAAEAMGFPPIPGVPSPANAINQLPVYDFGPAFRDNDLSGWIAAQPPAITGAVPLLVPRTDSDGNEVGGIPLVLNQAPLGSYLGWNITASGYAKGSGCGFTGGFVPFAITRAERLAAGDPRPSLEERYGSHDGYVGRVRLAVGKLVQQRFLLPEDAGRIVREAEASGVLR